MGPRSGFINRRGELSVLSEEAGRAFQGEPRIVYLRGAAGMGKTALIERFLADHAELMPVVVAGAEAEADVHLGVAEALVRVLTAGAGLAADPAVMLGGSDPLACGVSLVELLGLAQGSDGGIAVVVDDLQWVDSASVVALAFALRRLNSDRILAVFAGREEVTPEAPLGRLITGPRGRGMRLEGLDVGAVKEMASRLGSSTLTAAHAAVLRSHTGGNPLHLRALMAELPAGWASDTQRLPAPRPFAAIALAPLARAPEPSRKLVAAAAVLGMEARLADAARLAAVAAPEQAAEAAPASLISLVEGPVGWMLRFTHPLNRAAVYHQLPPSERARLHGLAAEHTLGRAALWHRVRAASSPDCDLAADLMAAAADEAAHVHADAAARQRLVLDAADLRLWASDPAAAAALLAAAEDPSGCRWHYVHGHLAMVGGRLPEAQAELQAAWHQIGSADDDLRGPAASLLAQLEVLADHGESGAQWAARALAVLPPGHPMSSLTRGCLSLALWIAGRTGQAIASMAGLPGDAAAVAPGDAAQLAFRGLLRLWGDDLAGARADCARAIRLGRESGLPPYLLTAAAYLAEVEYRLGEWDDAVVHGDLAVSLVEDTDQLWYQSFAHSAAALVWAARGGWSVAETHVAAARTAAELLGNPPSHGCAANAAVHLAFARQDWPAVIAAATPLKDLSSHSGLFEPGMLQWRELYDEALIAVGRLADARRDIDESLTLANLRGRRSALARLSRPQAALALRDGRPDNARAMLEEGIEHAEAACGPFDLALLHDALGRLLRRQGERRQAACHLQKAHDQYRRLQAIPFLDRCGDELTACGLHPARRAPGATP